MYTVLHNFHIHPNIKIMPLDMGDCRMLLDASNLPVTKFPYEGIYTTVDLSSIDLLQATFGTANKPNL